jgi:UPF0271 protein
MAPSIDIGSDVAEFFAIPPFGIDLDVVAGLELPRTGERMHERHFRRRHDDEVLAIATSVHLCAGLHAGDPIAIYRVVETLAARRIRLGAHPSYPDAFRFGQRRMDLTAEETKAAILYQIAAVDGVLKLFGRRVEHVKLHGILAIDTAYHEAACDVFLDAISRYDRQMPLYLIAGSPSIAYARSRGFTVVAEGIVDRNFDAHGHVLPRSHPQAELHDPDGAARRLVAMIREGRIASVDGAMIDMHVDSVCLHSDTPSAPAIARAVASRLTEAGIAIRPFGGE